MQFAEHAPVSNLEFVSDQFSLILGALLPTGLNFRVDWDNHTLKSEVTTDEATYNLVIALDDTGKLVEVAVSLQEFAEVSHLPELSELVIRSNCGLRLSVGRLDVDLDNGTVSGRACEFLDGDDIENPLYRAFQTALAVTDRFYPSIHEAMGIYRQTSLLGPS